MEDGKILSVIVPTYNMEKLLDQCLSSFIVSQDLMPRLEVLVINDGSKDRSSEIAHAYEWKYPLTFRVVDKSNGNYGSCINAALGIASGKYVKVVDADDFVLTEGLESLMRSLLETDVDAVISNKLDVDAEGESHGFHPLSFAPGHVFTPDEIGDDDLQSLFIHNFTYRTSLFKTIEYKQTEGISYTDLEWIYYPMAVVHTIKFDPSYVYCYRHGREGQTVGASQRSRSMWMEEKVIKQMYERYSDIVRKSNPSSQKYLERRLMLLSARLYFYYLLEYNKVLNEANLRIIDDMIRSLNSRIYKEMDRVKCKTYLGSFNYIHNWRKKQTRKTVKFMLYDVYRRVSRLRHSILGS